MIHFALGALLSTVVHNLCIYIACFVLLCHMPFVNTFVIMHVI